MAYLIGSADVSAFSSSITHTSEAGLNVKRWTGTGTGGPDGKLAASSANAAILQLSIVSWGSVTNLKACLYDEGSLVEIVTIPSSEGAGVISVAMAGSTAITSGNNYVLGFYTDSDNDITFDARTDGAYLYRENASGGSYASPSASLGTGVYESQHEIYWAIQDAAAVAEPEQDNTGNIPLTPAAGWTSYGLVDPVFTLTSTLRDYTGDAAVTSDALEVGPITGLGAGMSISFLSDGRYNINDPDGTWVDDISFPRRVIQADGTIGITQVMTIEADAVEDTTPDAYTFTDQTGLEPSTLVESNEITVAGVDAGEDVTISVTGGEYAVSTDGGTVFGAFTSTSTTVQLGYVVKVRGTTSASYSTGLNVVLTVGGVSDTFTATTRAPVAPTVQTQPTGQTVTEGADATFTAAFNNGLSLQWFDASDDSTLAGETSASLVISTVLGDNGNTYYCVATGENGLTAQTNTVSLTVNETVYDLVPDQMDLGADVTNAELSTTVDRTFTITGIDAGQTVDVTATGSATVSAATGQLGDTITVSLDASGSYDAVVTGGVTINGVSDSFQVTTRSAIAPVTPEITVTGGLIRLVQPSATYADPTVSATDSNDVDVSNTAAWSGDTVNTSAALINRVDVSVMTGAIENAAAGQVAFVPDGSLPQGSYQYEGTALDENGDPVTFAIGARVVS